MDNQNHFMKKLILAFTIIFSFFTSMSYSQDLFTTLTYDELLAYSKEFEKPFYIDFTASWCLPCKMMEETVFLDSKVIAYTHENYLAIQLDVDDFDAMILRSEYNVNSLPTILFFNPKGKLVGRVEGLTTGTSFLQVLQKYN